MGGGGSKSVEFVDDETSLGRRRKAVVDVALLSGLLGDGDDLRAFCMSCDNFATLRFNPSIARAVVLEGELVAYVSVTGSVRGGGSSPTRQRMRSFTKGQSIPFFLHDKTEDFRLHPEDPLRFLFADGLELQFEAKTPNTRCLQIDRKGVNGFLSSRPHLTGARALFSAELTSLLSSSPELPIIDLSWGRVLSPLVDLEPFLEGDLIESWSDPPCAAVDVGAGFSCGTSSCVGMILLGRCCALEQSFSCDNVLDVLDTEHMRIGSYNKNKKGLNGRGSAPATSPASKDNRKKSISRINWDEVSSCVADIGPGSVLGAQNSFLMPRKSVRSVFARTGGVIAYFTPSTMQALAMLNPTLLKMWKDAFTTAYMSEVKRLGRPLLRSVSELNVQFLATKCAIESRPAGSLLLKQGEKAEWFYFVVDGKLEEAVVDKDKGVTRCRVLLTYGQYGSSALLANMPFAGNVTVLEPTVLLRIPKNSFMSIFSHDTRLIAEIRLRVSGGDVELASILRHPEGYHTFLAFVTKEFAAENVLFWKAAEEYQEKVKTLVMEGVNDSFAAARAAMLAASANSSLSVSLSSSVSHRQGAHGASLRRNLEGSTGSTSRQAATLSSSCSISSSSPSPSPSPSSPSASFDGGGDGGDSVSGVFTVTDAKDIESVRRLHAFAREMVGKFVTTDAEYQINIPFSMRTAIEAALREWTTELTRFDDESRSGTQGASPCKLSSSVYSLFEAAQREVYAFTSRDNFQRWKKTDAFTKLLNSIKDSETLNLKDRLDLEKIRLASYRDSYTRVSMVGELLSAVDLGGVLRAAQGGGGHR